MRRGQRFEKGQATLEMALVLPILLLLLLGVAQVATLLSAYLTVQAAAQEGARLGILGVSDSAIVARVDKVASDLSASNLHVAVSPAPPRMPGSNVTVTVDYSYPVTSPFLQPLLGSTVQMQSVLTMRVQ